MADRTAVRVTDLRGAPTVVPGAVLADPTGRRAARLRRVGRVVGTLFLIWFVCLVLAGLGLLPSSGIPLASSVSPHAQPTPLADLPHPLAPSPADLRPAVPLRAAHDALTNAATTTPRSGSSTGRRPPPVAPGRPKDTPRPATSTTGLAAAPGATTTPSGAVTPGTTTTGTSGTAPGHTKTAAQGPASPTTTTPATTTTPGRSGSAPGQTRTDTTGHGASH